MIAESLGEVDHFGREGGRVTFREARPQGLVHRLQELSSVGARCGEERDLFETRVAPARRVQTRGFAERESGLIERAARELVALHGRGQVFHQHHEVAAFGLDRREQAARCADPDRVGQLGVEAHLLLVGALGAARRPALRVVGRELADDRARSVRRLHVPIEFEAEVAAHLARPHDRRAGCDDPGACADTRPVQDAGEPLRRNLLGIRDDRRHRHASIAAAIPSKKCHQASRDSPTACRMPSRDSGVSP